MKRTIIVIIITIFILALCTYSVWAIKNETDKVIYMIDSAVLEIEKQNYKKAASIIYEAEEYWENKSKKLSYVTRKSVLDEAGDTIAELYSYAEKKDAAEFNAKANKAKNILKHIYECEMPSLEMLF